MNAFETVIGLEVHIRLLTRTKLFSGENCVYGGQPNAHTSAFTLAHPGTLPRVNSKALSLAVSLGLACHAEINDRHYFARKHYFYPDSPKGFQTTQDQQPFCRGGYLELDNGRRIDIHHMHLEEDAGKSLHDQHPAYTLLDFNRAGSPLVELVTKPCIKSAEEAGAFITTLLHLVQWIGVCDGNMEEGSLKCDVNISLRPRGQAQLGTRVEIKNLNSIRHIKKAISYEEKRLIHCLQDGITIEQQTRSYDEVADLTFPMRDKEDANDYRYFPEPDLPPIHFTPEFIASVADQLPELPGTARKRLQKQYGLSDYDIQQICSERRWLLYYENICKHTQHFKQAANWLIGPIRHAVSMDAEDSLQGFPAAGNIATIIQMVEDGIISHSSAINKLFPAILKNSDTDLLAEAVRLDILTRHDDSELENWVNLVIEKMPDKVLAYRKGKKGLIGLFMGEVKKLSGGKADPKKVITILEEKLSSII
jgi:aspartyl-tRNA(Asn)/glutamyl-tRNA(Gln) amidotransferase subunit B